MYPTKDVALTEFEQKWVPEFMPRGEYKDHPVYGWRFDSKRMVIHFNSGVSVFFKSYSQEIADLQTITAWAVFVDEEAPTEVYDEIIFRITATDGYFSMVFTATIGQDFWYRAIELRGSDQETLPDAKKIQVSAYDCLFYDDGAQSPWTEEIIQRKERQCKSQNEILKRIYGRFVKDEGLKYPGFDGVKNRCTKAQVPSDWMIFGGVDVGSGGVGGHPAAILFLAVSPQYQKARVIKAWRGDGIVTTAADVLMKYIDLRENMRVTRQFYDWAAKDFGTIASRIGDPFEMAEKGHDLGEQVLNTLFKNQALHLDDGDYEIDKLAVELSMLSKDTDKRRAKDDLCDSLRYIVTKLPWDWTAITNSVDPGAADRKNAGPLGGTDELFRNGKISDAEYLFTKNSNEFEAEFDEINQEYEA